MARSRFSKIKGTKDFLVITVVCAFICLWSIRDAWFPTEKILKKHPLSYPVTVAVSGVVQTVPVKVGDSVGGSAPLLILGTKSYMVAVEAAEETYKAARGSGAEVVKEKLDALVKAGENLKATTVTCKDFILETTHGDDPLNGVVLEVLTAPATQVEAGDVVMRVKPKDTFYAFNKTLAVLTFFGAIVALIFHRIAAS